MQAKEPLFNRAPGEPTATKIEPPKEEFKDVFQMHKEEASQIRAGGHRAPKESSEDDERIDKLNQNLSGKSSYDLEQEFEELKKITPDDMKLAEEMIFKGYVETVVSMVNLPNVKYTITSTSADELTLADLIVFDYLKSKESKDGDTVEVPQTVVSSFKNMVSLSFAIKGRDDQDLCGDIPTCKLDIIKKAVKRLKSFEVTGQIENYGKMLEEIKKAIRVRAAKISELPTPVIDFLADKKYQFELKMFRIMTTKQIIPKS